ncbi:MAG: right-handed parallel beta-helix repeat-containing protein [Syntrophomonas sp.]
MYTVNRQISGGGLLLLFFIALFSIPACTRSVPVSSRVFYVSKNGSDSNPGTLEKPWLTVSKATYSLGPGDTVYIRGGTYAERISLRQSGAPERYITYTAYPGEKVIIDGSGIDWGYDWDSLVALSGQSYIRILGLTVVNSLWFGIGDSPDGNGCSNIIVSNCTTYNTRSSGIFFAFASYLTVENNNVSLACTSPSQEAISLCRVDNFTVRNNTVNDFAREGIDVKDGCTNGSVCNNEVRRGGRGDSVGRPGIYIDASSQHQFNIEVYGNRVSDCPTGICVATEAGGFLEHVNVHHNTVSDGGWGLAMGDWNAGYTHQMNDISFINNTMYNMSEGGIRLQNDEAHNIVVKDNLFGRSINHPIAYLSVNMQELTLSNNRTE